MENALRKARAVVEADAPPVLVLGVDTVVALAGRVYGKPSDERHARETLRALSGSTHTVLSGVALIGDGQERTALAATEVVFRTLDEGLIDWYVALGEWRDRAGGYGIQGAGAALVREVRGDYENVVGLPLATVAGSVPGAAEDVRISVRPLSETCRRRRDFPLQISWQGARRCGGFR